MTSIPIIIPVDLGGSMTNIESIGTLTITYYLILFAMYLSYKYVESDLRGRDIVYSLIFPLIAPFVLLRFIIKKW